MGGDFYLQVKNYVCCFVTVICCLRIHHHCFYVFYSLFEELLATSNQ